MKASVRLIASGLLTFGLLAPEIGSAGVLQRVRDIINLGPMKLINISAIKAADAGGIAGGGGNTVNGRLFDFYENSGTMLVDLEQQPFFKTDVLPVIDRIEKGIPEFGGFLRQGILLKRWYIESKPIKEDGCINPSMIEADQVIAACQDRIQVRLSQKALQTMTPENRAGLIIHELILHHGLEMLNRTDRSASWHPTFFNYDGGRYELDAFNIQKAVRELVRAVFDLTLTSRDLRDRFSEYHFANFMTGFEANLFAQIEALYRKNMCSVIDSTVHPPPDMQADVRALTSSCMNGIINRCETGMLDSVVGSYDLSAYLMMAAGLNPFMSGGRPTRVASHFEGLKSLVTLLAAGPFTAETEKLFAIAKKDLCSDFTPMKSIRYGYSDELGKAWRDLRAN